MLPRTVCVWSSKTNRFVGAPVAAHAADSSISMGFTSKNWPNTSFIARRAAAVPPVPARNCRRLRPSFLAAPSASSSVRASTRFCFSVWGGGMYSPFETIWVGIGIPYASVSSAGVHCASCSSLSQASSSRDPGTRCRKFGYLAISTFLLPDQDFDPAQLSAAAVHERRDSWRRATAEDDPETRASGMSAPQAGRSRLWRDHATSRDGVSNRSAHAHTAAMFLSRPLSYPAR